jgi:hypothetical protein
MFSEPRINVIQSDEGYSIEFHGIDGLEYSEGEASVFMYAGSFSKNGTSTLSISRHTIKFWSSRKGSRPVTEEERAKILERISAACKWKDMEVEIWDYSPATGLVKV